MNVITSGECDLLPGDPSSGAKAKEEEAKEEGVKFTLGGGVSDSLLTSLGMWAFCPFTHSVCVCVCVWV